MKPAPAQGGQEGRQGAPRRSLPLHRTDLLITAVILAICAFFYYQTTQFDEVPQLFGEVIPPAHFPRLVLGAIVLLALLLPFENAALAKGGTDLDEDRRSRIKPMAYWTAGLLTAVVAATPWLGTFLSMVLACALLPLLWGERRLWLVAAFALLFPVAIGLLFVRVLEVQFLPGILGHIFR